MGVACLGMGTEALAVGQHTPSRSAAGVRVARGFDELGELIWVPVETELQAQR